MGTPAERIAFLQQTLDSDLLPQGAVVVNIFLNEETANASLCGPNAFRDFDGVRGFYKIKNKKHPFMVSGVILETSLMMFREAVTTIKISMATMKNKMAQIKAMEADALKSKAYEEYMTAGQMLRVYQFVADFAAGSTTTPLFNAFSVLEELSDETQSTLLGCSRYKAYKAKRALMAVIKDKASKYAETKRAFDKRLRDARAAQRNALKTVAGGVAWSPEGKRRIAADKEERKAKEDAYFARVQREKDEKREAERATTAANAAAAAERQVQREAERAANAGRYQGRRRGREDDGEGDVGRGARPRR